MIERHSSRRPRILFWVWIPALLYVGILLWNHYAISVTTTEASSVSPSPRENVNHEGVIHQENSVGQSEVSAQPPVPTKDGQSGETVQRHTVTSAPEGVVFRETAENSDSDSTLSAVGNPSVAIFGEETVVTPQRGVFSCDGVLGFGLLDEWNSKAQKLCDVAEGTSNSDAGELTCRMTVIPFLPEATRPHTLCDSRNVVVDFARMAQCNAPKHRSHYSKGQMVYYCYENGAFAARCRRSQAFQQQLFPRDHLRDIFTSFDCSDDVLSFEKVVEHPVLFVTREGNEYANLFHTSTDFLNAFQSLYMAGVPFRDVEVVLLDANPPGGPFDVVWSKVFAPKHGLRHVSDFHSTRVLFRRAVFSPPGYSSLFFSFIQGGSTCPNVTGLMLAFKHFFLNSFGLTFGDVLGKAGLHVTVVSRRPYSEHGVEHSFMDRKTGNEDALVDILKGLPQVSSVQAVEFARIAFEEQVQLIAKTDLLVAQHGAALSHMCWLPEHGGVVEVCVDPGVWHLFENMAFMNGLVYSRLDNSDPASLVKDGHGSTLTVNEDEFRVVVERVVAVVAARKAAARERWMP